MKQDLITLDRIKLLHPKLRDEALCIYNEICERLTGKALCRFSRTLSSFAEQDEIYKQGRSLPGPIVTYARGGQSYHNYGLAIDNVFLIDKDGNGSNETASWDFKTDFDGDGQADWEEVNFVFEMHGWKGLYKADGKRWDLPHFQKTLGYDIVELQKRFNDKRFMTNTNYLIL